MSEVTDLIAALRAGSMTLEQVAQRFRDRRWPDAQSPSSALDPEPAGRVLEDPAPYVAGSFDDVAAAFHRKELTAEEYDVLARAAAESINAEDSGERLGNDDPRGWD